MKGNALPQKTGVKKRASACKKIGLVFLFVGWLVSVVLICYFLYQAVADFKQDDIDRLKSFLTSSTMKPTKTSTDSETSSTFFLWFFQPSEPVQEDPSDIEDILFRKKRAVLSSPVGQGQQGNSRLYCDVIKPCVHVCHDWFESYRNVDKDCLGALAMAKGAAMDPDENSCKKGLNKRPLIMGNGGGDSKNACENTFEATEAGLAAGMNAVRIDLSMSAEGIVFLWRDHLPSSLMARIRQNGLMFVEKCKPMYLPRSFRPAHTLSWGQIRASWFYTDFSNSPQESTIPTLEDWVFNYGLNDQIEKVWLDVHCPEFLVDEILIRGWKLFEARGIAHKLYFTLKPDGMISFPKSLHLIGQINLEKDVKNLNDQSFEQLSNLIVSPLRDSNNEVQVITNEDFTFFSILRKLVNNSKSENTVDSRLGATNIFLDLVVDGDLIARVKDLSNETTCPNLIIWVVDKTSQIEELKCSAKNVEAIITNFPARAKKISCATDSSTGTPAQAKQRNSETANTKPTTTPKPVSCDIPCPRILWPVCGSDDKIYPNECLLEKAACESKTEIKIKTGGDCDPPVFKLLEKQQEGTKDSETKVAALCDKISKNCTTYNFNIDATVCGSDGMLYENRCLFERSQCSTNAKNTAPNLKEVKNCVKNICLLVCSDESRPVCGTDGITYRNACALVRMNCLDFGKNVRLFHYNSCGNCNFKCDDANVFSPVCGSDGITYQNKCALYQTACFLKQPIFIVSDGKCQPRSN